MAAPRRYPKWAWIAPCSASFSQNSSSKDFIMYSYVPEELQVVIVLHCFPHTRMETAIQSRRRVVVVVRLMLECVAQRWRYTLLSLSLSPSRKVCRFWLIVIVINLTDWHSRWYWRLNGVCVLGAKFANMSSGSKGLKMCHGLSKTFKIRTSHCKLLSQFPINQWT